MTSGPTYYDLFGVSPAATPAQLRAAYLSLMKQHHPDLVDGCERPAASDFSAFVNHSYAVLRNPDARARYNAHLADQSFLKWSRIPKRRALLTGAVHRSRPSRWDRSSLGAGFLIVATIGVALAAAMLPPRAPEISWAAAPQAARAQGPALPEAVVLDEFQARDQARRAILATREEAVLSSQDCFRSARNRLSRRDTELCVIFDEAYLDWQDASSVPLGRDDYFNQLVVGIRHRDALAALGSAQPVRLDQLRDIALNALLAEIRDSEPHLPQDASYIAATTLLQTEKLSQ
jgi:DnaJ-like protein